MRKLTPDQYKGLAGTILFHVLLVFALMLLALRTPLPLPGEEGVEVNIGYDEQGMGVKQAENSKLKKVKPVTRKKEVENKQEKQEKQKSEPQKKVDENITQNDEDTPALKQKKEEKKSEKLKKKNKKTDNKEDKNKESKKEKTKHSEKQVVNERALFKGSSKKKDGENQGVLNKSGNQGKPHGYKESTRYDGTGGEGDGIQASLGGRGSKYLEKPSIKITETGTVVVTIWVNPQGKVIRAKYSIKGTTVVDKNLIKVAENAALNSTFEKDPSAPPEQRGTITYRFILMK